MTSVIKKNNLIATEANEGRVDGTKGDNQPAAAEVKTFGGGRKGKRKRAQRNNNQSNRTSCSSVNGMKGRHHQFEAKRRKLPSDNSTFKAQQNDGLKMVRLVPAGGGMTGKQNSQTQHQSHALKPRAPNNTTSFLMSDREKRQHEEDDQQQMDKHHHTDGGGSIGRSRCQSTSNIGLDDNEATAFDDELMEDGSEEQRDADFEECLFSTAIERIERLSREEVDRELLLMDRDNRALKQRVALLKESHQQLLEENQKLKSLLKAHGTNLSGNQSHR